MDCTTYRDFPDDDIRGHSTEFSRVVYHDMLVSLTGVLCGCEVGAWVIYRDGQAA